MRRKTASCMPGGIVRLSEFEQKLSNTQIHNSLIVQYSNYWPEAENQPNLIYVDNARIKPAQAYGFPQLVLDDQEREEMG